MSAIAIEVGGLYAAALEFERYAARMADCSGLLLFGWSDEPEIGETRLIDANPKIRAPVIAHFAPFELSKYDEKPKSFIREFLERYGNSVSVRNALSANYYTESWSGLTSVHLTNKADKLKEYLKTERDKNVKKWLDREISDLENRITEALIVEERNER